MRESDLACPDCGYSLLGLDSLSCPECGQVATPEQLSSIARLRRSAKWAIPLHLVLAAACIATVGWWVHGRMHAAGWDGYIFISFVVVAQLFAGHLSFFGLPSSTRNLWRAAWMSIAPLLQVPILFAIAVAWLGSHSLSWWNTRIWPSDVRTTFFVAGAVWLALALASAIVAVWLWRGLKNRFASRHTPRRVVVGLTLSVILMVAGGLPPIAFTCLMIVGLAFT